MTLDQINLWEGRVGYGFRGTLKDLLRDVYESSQHNPGQEFNDNEYSKIEIAGIQILG